MPQAETPAASAFPGFLTPQNSPKKQKIFSGTGVIRTTNTPLDTAKTTCALFQFKKGTSNMRIEEAVFIDTETSR